jgi:hypothetical protein
MNYSDWLVGLVAAILGTAIFLAGALNWEQSYRFRPARWIESTYGRGAARTFYVLLGLGLIGLGVAISQGWRFQRAKPRAAVALSGAPRWR